MLIGVVQHDPLTRRRVVSALQVAGHATRTVAGGRQALVSFSGDSGVEVVVLDTTLPDGTGRDLCLALRAAGQDAPVIFVAAAATSPSRVEAFRAGADDFVTLPFEADELVARIEALGRRHRRASPALPTGLRLDPSRHAVCTDHGEQVLTPTEYRLLAALTARPAEVVRRHALAAAAWPADAAVSDNSIDAFVRRVRVKLELVGSTVRIHTVRGVGFRLS